MIVGCHGVPPLLRTKGCHAYQEGSTHTAAALDQHRPRLQNWRQGIPGLFDRCARVIGTGCSEEPVISLPPSGPYCRVTSPTGRSRVCSWTRRICSCACCWPETRNMPNVGVSPARPIPTEMTAMTSEREERWERGKCSAGAPTPVRHAKPLTGPSVPERGLQSGISSGGQCVFRRVPNWSSARRQERASRV